MISVKNLNKYYHKGKSNEIHVINDTSLSLPDTGFICILGESGSGKTTLLNTMGGLDDFKSGEITYGEDTLVRYNAEKMDRLRMAHCAYIFQNYYLLMDHTVEYNIRLTLNMYDISEEEKSERIDYVLRAVDMLKYKKRAVGQLSGGQQQRVAIARALAKSPEVIFADEPTGNLDDANTMRIMRILKQVSKKCLVVMVTHEKRIARVFADRIIHVVNGRVDRDELLEGNRSICYNDYSTIYLKEYTEKKYTAGPVELFCYGEGEELPPLKLRIICDNGRCYIQAPEDASVTFLEAGGDRKVLDEERPEYSGEELLDEEYRLETLHNDGLPRLSMAEIVKTAFKNLKLLGKQQIFLVICFVAMAVLLVLSAADIMTLNSIDIKNIVRTDSGFLYMESVRKGTAAQDVDKEVFNEKTSDILEALVELVGIGNMHFYFPTDLSYVYDGFVQIQEVNSLLGGYSIAFLEDLDEDALIYGRMPERYDEIVIDKWVADKFIHGSNTLAQLIPDAEALVGRELSIKKKNWTLKIVGISDTHQPDIYMDKYTCLGITTWTAVQPSDIQELRAAYPGQYDDVELTEDQALVSEGYLKQCSKAGEYYYFTTPLHKRYYVAGTYPDEYGAGYVLGEDGYRQQLLEMLCQAKEWIVRVEDEEMRSRVYQFINENNQDDQSLVQLYVVDNYALELADYEAARAIKVNARMIITIAIFAVSIVLLYFSMKSNAVRKIQDIAVYRLLGIKKSGILLIFGLETAMLTSYTTLPAVLAATGVLKFIASIPSLESKMVFSWGAAGVILLFLYIVNIIAGILPVLGMLKLPPAKLAAKYDL